MLGNLRRTLVLLVMVVPALADLQKATDAWRQNDPDTALAQIQPHLKTVDEESRAWHELYQDIHLAQKHGSEMQAEYQMHLKQTPTPDAHYLLARITFDFPERERLLQAGLALAPKHAYLRREWARCVFRLGRLPEAKAAWLAAMEGMPEDMETYASYFQTMERLGQAEEGMANFRSWAREHPNMAFFQAMTYRCLQQRLPDEAKGFLEKAISLDPNHEQVLIVQAEAAFRLRQFDVVQDFLEALEKEALSDRWMIWSGKIDVMVHKRAPEGLEKLLRYVRLHPLDPTSRSALATVYIVTNDMVRAKAVAERVIQMHPTHTEALFACGIVAIEEERFGDAIVDFKKSLEIDPESALTLRNLAICYQKLGQHAQAQKALLEAKALAAKPEPSNEIRLDRDHTGEMIIKDPTIVRAEGLCILGASLTQEGRLEEARENFLQAAKLAPTLVEPHRRLAVIEQMGFRNLEGAIKHWEKALETHPPGGSVRSLAFTVKRLALAYHRQGEREKARRVLEAFMRDHEQVSGNDSNHAKLLDALSKPEDPTKVVRLADIAAVHCAVDDYCLPQSIATILNYWKLPDDVEGIGKFIGEGKYMASALSYLDGRSEDISYRCFTPKQDVVQALVRRGFPVMLIGQFLMPNGENYQGHATVMVGYDEILGHVLIEDANWFQAWDTLPFADLEELRGIVIAPTDKLATLEIDLPDEDYHDKLIALEPFIDDEDAEFDIAAVKAMVALQPNHWWGHLVKGKAYTRLEDDFEAELAFTKASEVNTQSALPHMLLANIYIEDGLIGEACDWIRRALEREPNLHAARKLLITRLFNPENKREDFQARLRFVLDEGDQGNKHQLEEALRECKRYLQDYPDDVVFLLIQVACELKLRLYEDAEQSARKLVLLNSNIQMSLWLSLSLHYQGNSEEALACLDTAMKQAPSEAHKAYLMKWKKEFSEDSP